MPAQGSPETERLDLDVRLHVFRSTAESGNVPRIHEITAALDQPRPAVEEALRRLAAGRVLVLSPSSPEIWMANPFSATPTPFRVTANARRYYANCIWDALGIPAAVRADGRIEAECGDCGDPMTFEVRDEALAANQGIIHFGVPAARWWVNIGFT